MRCLSSMCSKSRVSTNSWPLRSKVRSPDNNKFFASCWVMVEPPMTLGGLGIAATLALAGAACLAARSWAFSFFCQAFSSASQSTPSWLANVPSSEAITARLRWSEIWLYGTHLCCHRSCRSAVVNSRQASDRSKAVDSGATTSIRAIRPTKKSCNASAAKATSTSQRNRGRILLAQGGAELGQHLCGRRTHAAPQPKRLGRLLDQHAQTVARNSLVRVRPVHKACCGWAVHHVQR